MKKKFLVVDDNSMIRDLVSMALESETDCEIVFSSSGNGAILELKKQTDFNLIISDYNMPDGTGGDLFIYLQKQSPDIPFLLLTAEDLSLTPEFINYPSKNHHGYLGKPFKLDEFHSILGELVNIPKGQDSIKYRRIRIDYLMRYKELSAELYLILGSGKVIQLTRDDDCYSLQFFQNYKQKGLEFLYVKAEDFSQFVSNTHKQFQQIFKNSKVSQDQKITAQMNAVHLIQDQLFGLGLSPESMKTAQASMDATIEILKVTKRKQFDLDQLLKQITEGNSLFSKLAVMSNYLSVAIAMETEWSSRQTYQKLSMASIFADLSLTQEFENVACLAGRSVRANLPEVLQKKYFNHPFESAKLYEQIGQDPDVVNIIQTHHERPDGTGFPKQLDQLRTTPIACIFNIAQELSCHVLTSNESSIPLKNLVGFLDASFTKGHYKRPLAALMKLT